MPEYATQRVLRWLLEGGRKSDYDPYTLSTFLLSKYGRVQTDREATGNVQPNLFLYKIKELRIPNFSMDFQAKVSRVVRSAVSMLHKGESLLRDAEDELEHALGIDAWRPTEDNISVKTFADAVNAGRIDAEYFQPKFDDLNGRLAKMKVRTLGGKTGIADVYKSIDPPSEFYGSEGVPFVRISDFSKLGIEKPEVKLPPEICKDCKRIEKDEILLSKDGSIGIAYKAEEKMDMVTSGAILHLTLRDREVNSDYLTLLLNSRIVQMQAERDAGGSIIQHWKPSQVEAVQIPILPRKVQDSLAKKVRKAFALRKESKKLIAEAKQMVEDAIEGRVT